MSELLPFVFMFACVLLLVPFFVGALFTAFDGDRRRGRGELLGSVDPRIAARYGAPTTTTTVVDLPRAAAAERTTPATWAAAR